MHISVDIKLNKRLPSHFSWALIGLIFVVSFIFILATVVPVSQGAVGDNISGWAWSPQVASLSGGRGWNGFGLTSFNDCWCIYPTCLINCWSDLGTVPYGLTVDFSSREITGWAWSNSVGWICFGNSCSDGPNYSTDFFGTGDNPSLTVTYPYSDSQDPVPLSGWAKIIIWGNHGWLSLKGPIQGTGETYGLTFSTTTLAIQGLAWNSFSDPGIPLGDLATYKGYGWFCVGERSSYPSPLGTDLCEDSTVQVSVPYIKTVSGDVYVRGDINPDLQPVGTNYNATYLVLATGEIQNFSSEELNKPLVLPDSYLRPNYNTSVILPRSSQNYYNILGLLDVDGLSQEVINKYGTFTQHTDQNINQGFYDDISKQRVIMKQSPGTETLLGPLTMSYKVDGGITFIVNGDLHVVGDVSYATGNVNDFKKLPSVSFIVLGDLLIDPGVENLAGNFVVLGNSTVNPNLNCPNLSSDTPNHCGAIYTGVTSDNHLTSYGIMMARKFFFQRTTADVINSASEQIIYDGRLLVNPPPGFKDLSKGLPIFSQVAPQ